MIAIDTNLLLRYFIEDDIQQSDLVDQLIRNAIDSDENVFISDIVLCEFVWALRCAYNADKSDVIRALEEIYSAKLFRFQNNERFKYALKKFSQKSGDFADYMLGYTGFNHHVRTTYTFDKKLSDNDYFTLLS